MNTTDSTIHSTAPYSQQSGICIYIYIYLCTVLQLHCIELPKAYFAKLQEFVFTTCFFFGLLLKRRMDNDESNPYTFDNDLNLDFAVCLENFPPQNGSYSTTAQTFLLHLAGDVCPW